MDIRQLQYLVALAREKHFTRAAEACNVTQPTLSGRIRQLETELGVPIVERGQRYHGLTPEGERVLRWAQSILESCAAMTQELSQAKGGLSGRIVLGVIPSALPMEALLSGAVRARFPAVSFTVLSHTSQEILQALDDFAIDAGITYLDNEPVEHVRVLPLYTERYCLFVKEDHELARRERVSWAEAAQEPLCLLTPNMQNRRIIDRAFALARCRPEPEIETNSVINLCSHVRMTGMASVMPEYFLDLVGPFAGIRAVPLIDPTIEQTVGLVVPEREPLPPLIAALVEVARAFRMPEPGCTA